MKTRLSKHGKYEIMEGSYGEMKDLLQPGDILRTLDDVPEGMKRSDFDVRLVRRIPSQEIMDQVMENLPLPSKATAIFAMVESPTEGFSHSWAVQNLKNGMMYIWFGEHDDTPCLIKRRRITEDTTEDSDSNVHVGPITGKHVNTDSGEEPAHDDIPNTPGWWVDREGELWIVARRDDDLVMDYMSDAGRLFIPCSLNHWIDVHACAGYAPFRQVDVSYEIRGNA